MSDKGFERMSDALVRAVAALEKIAEELGAIDQTLNSLLVIYAGTVADEDDYTDLAFSTVKEQTNV